MDQIVQVCTIIGYSLPTFLISILFIWIFAAKLGIFPPSGMKTVGTNYTGIKYWMDSLYYMALPLLVMTFCSLGGMTRYVRASMIEALSMDCIKTARAKGLREQIVIYSHAWRNALIPIVTAVGSQFSVSLGGAVVTETVFAWPGVGRLIVDSINTRDDPTAVGAIMLTTMLSSLVILAVDIIYAFVDPRVKARYSR